MTPLTPGFRQQLPHGCCPHLGEESAAMDRAEVGYVAQVVQLVSDDDESCSLQHATASVTTTKPVAYSTQQRQQRRRNL